MAGGLEPAFPFHSPTFFQHQWQFLTWIHFKRGQSKTKAVEVQTSQTNVWFVLSPEITIMLNYWNWKTKTLDDKNILFPSCYIPLLLEMGTNSRCCKKPTAKICHFKGRKKYQDTKAALVSLIPPRTLSSITNNDLQKLSILDPNSFRMDLPQVRCLGSIVAIQFKQRICPQTISNKEYQALCWRWQWSLLRSHTMNQRGAEVDVKNRGHEDKMHKETSKYEDWYTHGNWRPARKNPTLERVREIQLVIWNLVFIYYYILISFITGILLLDWLPRPITNLYLHKEVCPEKFWFWSSPCWLRLSDSYITAIHLWHLQGYQMASKDNKIRPASVTSRGLALSAAVTADRDKATSPWTHCPLPADCVTALRLLRRVQSKNS